MAAPPVLALAAPGQGGQLAVTVAVLVAAVLHAAWNALAARLPDKLAGLGAIGLAQIVLGALALAAATGVAIAAYTVTDGLGVRQTGSALGYFVWLNFLHGLGMVACAAAYRRSALPAGLRRAWPAGVVIMLLSSLAYGLVLWAQQRGALAAVAALRETSVLLAAAIGTLLFNERFGRVRVLAAALVAGGIVLLNLP